MLGPALFSLLGDLPVFLVWIVAAGVAVARWRRHPNVSLLVVLALALEVVLLVAGRLYALTAPMQLREAGASTEKIGQVMALVHFALNGAHAVAFALLLVAGFGWRKGQTEAR